MFKQESVVKRFKDTQTLLGALHIHLKAIRLPLAAMTAQSDYGMLKQVHLVMY
jgi:hypothetical protein